MWDGSGRRLTPKNGEAARYLKRMRTVAVAQVLCGNRFVLLVNHPNLPDPQNHHAPLQTWTCPPLVIDTRMYHSIKSNGIITMLRGNGVLKPKFHWT